MSLLMDALKKAEQAKRGNQIDTGNAGTTASSPALELASLGSVLRPVPASISATRPEIPEHLAILDEEFQLPPARTPWTKPKASPEAVPPGPAQNDQGQHRPKPRPATTPAEREFGDDESEAAQHVFQGGQASEANKLFPIALATLSVIAIAIIGIYFWMQLRTSTSAVLLPAAGVPPPAQPTMAAGATTAPRDDTTTPSRRLSANARPTKASPHAAGVQLPSNALAGGDDPIRITTAKLQVNPTLMRGYEAFSAGRLGESRNEYEQLLKNEPNNGEALLGMAAISLRLGQPGQAEAYYLRAIEADPKDALAQAGLIALRSQADPIQSESRLKNLISAQPTLATLHLALGNLYAAQGRWNEAQQAYFIAYAGAGDNPDIVFNLAVSLDHLQQPALAAQYYKQALDASASRQGGFDPAQVSARLRDLSQ